MKTLLLLLNLTQLVAASCQKETANEIGNDTEIWWINSSKMDCTGVGPMTCFQIQKSEEIESGNWELLYSQIEGFTYEPGNLYQVKVEVIKKPEPIPADASSLTFKLVEIMSKELDPALALTNIWKLLHVGSIKDPKSNKGESLTFEFNGSQGTYFGNTDCNSIRGGFSVEKKDQIRFGPGASTVMACPSMEVEMEVKKVLELIRKFEIENNVLYLRNESGLALMSLRAVD